MTQITDKLRKFGEDANGQFRMVGFTIAQLLNFEEELDMTNKYIAAGVQASFKWLNHAATAKLKPNCLTCLHENELKNVDEVGLVHVVIAENLTGAIVSGICAECSIRPDLLEAIAVAQKHMPGGACYKICGAKFIGSIPAGTQLVHGIVAWPHLRHHAWLQYADGRVWDNTPCYADGKRAEGMFPNGDVTQGCFWSPEEWASVAKPKVHATYSRKEARELYRQSGNWGPWT